jgi:MYXO-CTERM domain-containing protein
MSLQMRSLVIIGLGLVVAGEARAHIHLVSPPSWTSEDALGDPQKSAPCGGESGTPTGAVTQYRPGQTIMVQWAEAVYHPGHFRIAFTDDRGKLVDPAVTLDANQVSVSAAVEDPPVAPVLLDNLYPRTDPNGSAGTMFTQAVTLPNVTCAHCTLQLIQFMAGHGPPNYIYHHCADLELTSDVTPVDAGAPTAAHARGGCSVASGGGDDALAIVLLTAAALVLAARARFFRTPIA